MPSCADRRSGETYKPKGGGKFKEKHEDQRDAGRCIDKCVEDGLDVAVYNTGSDSCYCWEEDEGRWEDAGNGDVAYEVSHSDGTALMLIVVATYAMSDRTAGSGIKLSTYIVRGLMVRGFPQYARNGLPPTSAHRAV